MSKNETLTSKQETELNIEENIQLNSLFARLRDVDTEAPPYLKTRVLAHLKYDKKQNRSLLFWKALSAGSFLSLFFLGFISFNFYQKINSDGLTKQAYVIHIDFNQADKDLVVKAEVELPKDIHFVSSKKEIREERSLSLPVDVKAVGRGKLPFVVTADGSGEREIKVRLLNENNELVREQILKLKFAKQGTSINF